jgi:hypothetical protein
VLDNKNFSIVVVDDIGNEFFSFELSLPWDVFGNIGKFDEDAVESGIAFVDFFFDGSAPFIILPYV